MKKQLFALLCVLSLALSLAACGENTPADTSAPPTQTTPVETGAPEQAGKYDFQVLPVTEEGIRTRYGWDGYEVRNIVPYEGDYLVEYGYSTDSKFSLLAWVFGQTGRRVQLNGLSEMTSYEITGVGEVTYTTTGASAGTPWKGMPETRQVRVLGDGNGQLNPHYAETVTHTPYSSVWLDPAESFKMGFWSGDGLEPGGRYHQLYDARIDTDGLSFSFIPNGDSMEKFNSFFPAVTTIPCFDTKLEGNTFTIRLYNTCLESGDWPRKGEGWAMMEAYDGLYPCSFPAGSLGRDNHFLTDAEIRADGEDTVITCKLTSRAYRFTVETSNLGRDTIPSFRLVFREYDWEQDD